MEHQSTKERLRDALKELLVCHSMEKITVSDITKECGMGRQSFYYHFKDKYDLLDWIIRSDLEEYTAQNTISLWPDNIAQLLAHLQKEKKFYIRIANGQSELLFRRYSALIEKTMYEGFEAEYAPDENQRERLQFACRFFSYGFAGVLIQWICDGMKQSPEECIRHLQEIGVRPEMLRLICEGKEK